ncbi:DUF6776 family protein [Shewanella maritima]|uniref:DUF6776 family protein n=1 Tax=Shewanella maritima TaxID=2520507 RepID=UPI003735D03E
MTNYYRWLDRLQAFEHKSRTSGFYLLSLMSIAFFLGATTYNVWFTSEEHDTSESDAKMLQLEQQIQTQTREIAVTKLTLQIEQEANQTMRDMFNQQLTDQKSLEKELAFYRSLMVPDTTVEGIGIHALELGQGMLTKQYQLRLILTQLQKRKQNSKASAEIILLGVADGAAKEIDLGQLLEQQFGFDFTYFQILETEFTVPDGFELQRIMVKVNVKSRRGVKGGQTQEVYNVPELLGEKEQRVILEQNTQVIDNPEQQTEVRGSND